MDTPRRAGLAPIYLAITALVLASAVGFIVAIWPEDSQPFADRPYAGEAPAVPQPLQGSLLPPADSREPRRSLRWM